MPVNKKYLKIGVAGLAVTALVIGLSVGLTQKNKNSNNTASSNAAYETYEIDATDCSYAGKSGGYGGSGGSGKSGKSGGYGYSMSYYNNGKSGKSGNRALNVPGILEAYGDDTDASTGKRRKLRHQLFGRELYGSGKSGKSGGSGGYGGSGKSGKSGGYGGSGGSGKSGKAGSGSSSCYYEKVCKEWEKKPKGYGKSGKSGGSGGGSAKSGKSSPTTCYGYNVVQTTEAPPSIVETTFAPQECICEEQPWVWDGAMCVRSCDLTGPGSPSATACCSSNTGNPDCLIDDCGIVPSPSPTEGGTTTVATEKDGGEDPQGDDRGDVRP